MGTRGKAERSLLGQPESLLAQRWLEIFYASGDYSNIIPWEFNNRPQLPTDQQVLMLYYFFRTQDKTETKGVIITMVAAEVKRLWNMAGLKIVTDQNLKNQIVKLLEKYQKMIKESKRHNPKAEQRRKEWGEKMVKLFDCAARDAEVLLRKNRLLETSWRTWSSWRTRGAAGRSSLVSWTRG